jgi:hypothetical protein
MSFSKDWEYQQTEKQMTMDNEVVVPPPIATIPFPANGQKPDAPIAHDDDDETKVAKAAALMVSQFKQEREKLQIMCAEATLAVEGSSRRIQQLELDNAELRNNLQALQSQCEMLRQETSDLRAYESEQLAQLKFMVARAEHHEIPLPIRKRASKLNPKNGEST